MFWKIGLCVKKLFCVLVNWFVFWEIDLWFGKLICVLGNWLAFWETGLCFVKLICVWPFWATVFLHPPYNNEIQNQCVSLEYFLRKANVGNKSWRRIYGKTAMERAGKTTIFPSNASLRVCSENACTTANLNIVDLVEFYACLCSSCHWKHFTEQFKGTLGS